MKASSQFQGSALAVLLWLAAGLTTWALAAVPAASHHDKRHQPGRQLRGGRVRQRQLTRRQQTCRICKHRPSGGRQQRGDL